MLLLSKYHDFYDTAIGFGGIDKTIVYEREEKTVQEKALKIERGFYNGGSSKDEWIYFLIGFCGKTYFGLKLRRYVQEYFTSTYKEEFYYGEEIPEEPAIRKYKRRWNLHKSTTLTENIEKYHNKEHTELFFKYKVPSFLTIVYGKEYPHQNNLILNPVLKNWDFMQVFDPFTAFQEIQMFISGVLGTKENQVIVTADKYKILAAGFDLKTSFRKPKENQ